MHRSYQREPEQIKRQLEILKVLGFYAGPIVDVWNDKAINAMLDFEASPKFKPGIPNHGMPLGDRPYPQGIFIDPKNVKLLTSVELEQARLKEIEEAKAKAAAEAKAKADQVKVNSQPPQQANQAPQSTTPT